jgi:predicted ABC-type ATPase
VRIDRLETPDASDGLAGRQPGSKQDMRRRLDGLAHGHPSSPHREDGSDRRPVTDLQQYQTPERSEPDAAQPERSRPLTDAEHLEHVTEIRTDLEEARADGLATDQQHTIDPDHQQWTPARDRIQGNLVAELYERARDVPCGYRAVIAGGLGGAGKSTVLENHAGIDKSQYLTINPDDIKEEMASRGLVPDVEGLSPMEASDLAHEESSHIARQLAARAQADGKNVIWDITMSTRASTERRIEGLRSAGYTQIDGVFVDIPVETSVARADARHRQGHDDYRAGKGLGGRFVPAEVIRGQADPEWGSVNRKTFETVKSKLDRWSLYDNSVDGGAPMLLDARQREESTS